MSARPVAPSSESSGGAAPLGLATPVWAALLLGLWLIGHGYVGLSHDARLYLLQALGRVDPATYGADLFLAYGSQDQFTVFTRLWAPLLETFGPIGSTRLVGLAGVVLWWCAAALLIRRLLPGREARLVAGLLLLALPASYGPGELFRIGRHLATARVWSEALALFALWALLPLLESLPRTSAPWRDRRVLRPLAVTGLLILASLLVHPLMVLSVVAVAALVLVQPLSWRLRLLCGCLGAVAAVGAAWALGLDVLSRFDAEWLEIVRSRSAHLFVGEWSWRDLSGLLLATAFGVGVAKADAVPPQLRRVLGAAVGVAWLGVVANWIGADLLASVFITQLQVFRLSWLLVALVPLGLAAVVLSAGTRIDRWRAIAVLLAWSILLTSGSTVGQALCAAGLLLSVVIFGLKPVLDWWGGSTRRFLVWMLVALAMGFLSVQGRPQEALIGRLGSSLDSGTAEWTSLVEATVVPLLLIAALTVAMLASFDRLRGAAGGLGAALVLVGLVAFDQRDSEVRRAEGSAELAESLEIPESAQVFWEFDPTSVWVRLGRPSYFSAEQGAGVVFSRATAVEYERRRRLLGSRAGVPLHQGGDLPSGTDRQIVERACGDPSVGLLILRRPWHGERPAPEEASSVELAGLSDRDEIAFRCLRGGPSE